MRLLAFNAGSSSLKFDLLEAPADRPVQRLVSGAFVEGSDGTFLGSLPTARGTAPSRAASLGAAAALVLDWLADRGAHGADLLTPTVATVHRLVHGGERFRATTRLEAPELEALAALSPLAPLHNPPALAVLAAVRERMGAAIPSIGVFDTAYYAGLPPAAYRYAVPARWYEELGIRRYGFHGTAHRYMCQIVRSRLAPSRPSERIVSLQLGRGCSVTASLGERAIATSMGFTPLEGLVMGTRSGDLDAGAILFAMERTGMTPDAMRRELNEASGLKGLSGGTSDVRELLALERQGDAAAALALEVFCRRARHYLAAYIAELGGVDAIAFGGGIGENSPDLRRRIVAGLEFTGIAIEADANAACVGRGGSIAAPSSRAAVEVVPVDEASVLAREALGLLTGHASA